MNEIETINSANIKDKIHKIRDKYVILDKDLASLYHVMTGNLNKTVKRNIERFPKEFMFQLTEVEYQNLIFQNGISRKHGGNRKLPYAFTEQGVAMLSALLKSKTAINTSILIMNAFVEMKKYISDNLLEQRYINNMVLDHNERIKLIEESFSNKVFSNDIFFEGQIYDAYSLLLDILESSKESIIIIDNFANKKLFDLLSKTNKKVIVYSKNIDEELIKKYKSQYNNVELKYNDGYHDRFIIIDKKILYHCGASFKDLGIKCFGINKIDNIDMVNDLLIRL